MKIRTIILLILLCLPVVAVKAESKASRDSLRHELRIGWGDQLFETMIWRERATADVLPATMTVTSKEHYRYSQHWFAEYQYRFNYWFSLGGMFDGSGVWWDQVTRNGQGVEQSRVKNEHFYNLIVMPTVRFTYFHHDYVGLFSGIGVGMNINGGTETDDQGRRTVVAPAFQFTWLGLEVGHGHWFGTFALDGLFSMRNKLTVFQMGSKLMSASVGYRF